MLVFFSILFLRRFKMKILPILILIILLTGCSQQPIQQMPDVSKNTSNTTNTEIDINMDFISKIQDKEEYLKNKTEEDTTYVIYSYDGNSFNTSTFDVPNKNKYEQLALQISNNIGLKDILPTSITKNENKIIIDLPTETISFFNDNLKKEIIFLESYAKTFSENLYTYLGLGYYLF